MQSLTTAQIREKYLAYFESKGCKRMPSSSLIPDDPSLLLTSAGMVQFKPYFLQFKHLEAPYIGTTTVQKCVRTNDIDIIGTTGRHQSFFEMLGNFSFGEYFKEEMCAWAFDFSLNHLGLPLEKLYFTVFEDDEETIEIWKKLGVPEDHISRLGAEDNFWEAGPTGPCGPCSELYFDQGPEVGCGSPDCAPGCDCDRFLEYWNLVFTQYDRQEDGTLEPLPKKNIDTGMGLERIASVLQGVTTNYETDVLRSLIAVGERLSSTTYGQDAATDLALRIVADHSRAVTFMIADGILPSNEGRGYVLRRLLRRAVMKGHLIGIEGPFLATYIDEIINLMGEPYPEIVENRELVERVVYSEEERFGATLRQGQVFLEAALEELSGSTLSGKTAFTLHDTYGFPLEVTEEICADRSVTVDRAEFDVCMTEQKERARASAKDADAAWSTFDGLMSGVLERTGATEFVGYSRSQADAKVVALIRDGKEVISADAGATVEVVLDKTPFYAEKGGQIGDTGLMYAPNCKLNVIDTQEPEKGLIVHNVEIAEGSVSVDDELHASIDLDRRHRIGRNHTATHILHWALRTVLGDHVKQAGSFVSDERLRFDFTHFEGMTPEQLAQVESLANKAIMTNHPVRAYETSLNTARESGVIALFGEKYGDFVRVLDIDGVSKELCGGTHAQTTGEIGLVKIMGESSVGANLRRIEAVTSYAALEYLNGIEAELKATAQVLRVAPHDVLARTESNLKHMRELQSKGKQNNASAQEGMYTKLAETFEQAEGYVALVTRIEASDAGDLRNCWDVLKTRKGEACAVVLAAECNGKPMLLAAGTDAAVAAGFNAGAIIKSIASEVKGGGGGKPTMAQAGGKDTSGIDAALAAARTIVFG